MGVIYPMSINSEEPFRVDLASFSDLFKETESYSIPLYQRPYVWQREQNNRLWDDIVLCYRNRTNHFLGSIVLMGYQKDEFDSWYPDYIVEKSELKVWHVVDGQQRLTSMALLLAALYWDMDSWTQQVMGFDNFNDVQEVCEGLRVGMRRYLRTAIKDERDLQSGSKACYIPRLIPVRRIFSNYSSIINKNECGRKIRLDKMYEVHKSNICNFRNEECGKIYDNWDSINKHYEFYNHMCITLTNDIKFAKITCGVEQDPFQVFESLNGTGVNLSASDRIKNLLMGIGHKNNIKPELINNTWSEIANLTDASGSEKEIESFLSAYMFVKTEKRVSKGKLYDAFKDTYLKKEFDNNLTRALRDLQLAAKSYGLITRQEGFHDDERNVDVALSSETKLTLKAIMRNNRKQAVVPLLAAAQQYKFEESFSSIAKKLLSLLVRHKVCQLATNELDRIFGEFCKIVKEDSAQKAIALLDTYRQPDDKFANSFADLTFDDGDLSRAAYYLRSIEDYLRNRDGNDVLSEDDYTVEHIIPQTPKLSEWFAVEPEKATLLADENSNDSVEFFETTIRSIGNMCLLRRRENSGASNRNYDRKLEVYRSLEGNKGQKADATFMLVKQLEDNTISFFDDSSPIVQDGKTFDEDAVRIRARYLAKYATRIW